MKNLISSLVSGFVCLGLLSWPAAAQTFTTLHPFTTDDGGPLNSSLILAGNTLYGTAQINGAYNSGTIFKVNTDGTGFTNFYNFPATTGPFNTNIGGAYPYASLVLAGNTLYGTAFGGGKGSGTVFKINTDGSGFTNLYSFTAIPNYPYTNIDGAEPAAGLLLAGSTLFGVARTGGTNGTGTVFALNTNGSSFTNLHNFAGTDGSGPEGNLILSGKTLFGTANNGGVYGAGAIFAISTNGTGFTNLYSFTVPTGPHSTNIDGAYLGAGLLLAGNTLYGTAAAGGAAGNGTVFAVMTNGSAFTNLHSFTAKVGTPAVNGDGANPSCGLVLASNLLYGTAYAGGSAGNGTVFMLNTNGTGFATLHAFSALVSGVNDDGVNPAATLVWSNNVLYGTAYQGGNYGYGTVFSLWLEPYLAINRSTTNVVLSWPTNNPGFTLLATTNSSITAIWAAVSPAPVVVNTNNVVTNAISGSAKYYRLIR